jgi:hypothetical protein
MKQTKLKDLEINLEDGIITKEEYNAKKKEIEEMPEPKIEEQNEELEEVKLKADRILIVGAAIIILLFAVIFGLKYLTPDEQPKTIDEMHELNLKGKLKAEQGYLYNDVYSFVKFDDLWYNQMMSPKGTRMYNVQFRYGPKEVENINIGGALNAELLDNAIDYYVTFDPKGNDFASVALAVGDFNTHMTKIFFKKPIAACDKNETTACIDRPIITCENTDKLVLYVREANDTRVYFDDNCIVVEGSGFELVRGVDRILYDFYDIIEQ